MNKSKLNELLRYAWLEGRTNGLQNNGKSFSEFLELKEVSEAINYTHSCKSDSEQLKIKIMRAKEKANELANKFILKSVFDMTDEELKEQREQGKAFAIICVDEILNDNPNVYDSDRLNHKYWKEVKREIGLL